MWAKPNVFFFSKAIAIVLVLTVLVPMPVFGQFFTDGYQDEELWQNDSDFVESEDVFADDAGFSQDYSEGGQFIDEERGTDSSGAPVEGFSIQSRQSQLRAKGEQEIMPLNVAWGAGTGLLIGGWFALIQNSDDRTTQRAIGMGIVLGTGLGAFLGMRNVIFPNAPTASINSDQTIAYSTPLVSASLLPGGMQLGLNLKF